MVGANLAAGAAAAAKLLVPLPKRPKAALLLNGHKLAVGDEPVLVGLDKVIKVCRLVSRKALGGTVENLTATAKDSAVVDVGGVRPQIHAVDIALL